MYFGVVAVGVLGALVVCLRAPGMARVLITMAVVAAIAVIGGLGRPYSGGSS